MLAVGIAGNVSAIFEKEGTFVDIVKGVSGVKHVKLSCAPAVLNDELCHAANNH